MSKTKTRQPILDSLLLRRLLAGSRELRKMERRVPQLLANSGFRDELEREMLCSDRSGTTLTLLLLGVEPGTGNDWTEKLERLAQIVCDCTRKTDRKGWFRDVGGIRVGLILVHTPPERTQRIIDHIRKSYHERLALNDAESAFGGGVTCEIFTYPPYRDGASRDTDRETGERHEEETDHRGRGADGNGHQDGNGLHDGNGNGHQAVHGEGRPENHGAGFMVLPGPADGPPGLFASITSLLIDPAPLWKRALDVTVALAMVVVLSPLLVVIALLVKLTSPGPVIFKQPRVGYRGRTFLSWKFRSMTAGADQTKHQQYLASLIDQSSQASSESEERPMIKLDKVDSRITPVGRLLRITCLDELPQLFNVLKGEMSLVGPRPCLPYEADKYQRWHYQRLNTLPGITGLWQVKGKNKVTFRKMMRLDILYARQRSLWLDVKILFLTIPAVLREVRDGLLPAKKEEVAQ